MSRMELLKKIGILCMLGGMLAGCGPNLSDYQNEKPAMDVKAFFNGPIKAWGLVQDRWGNVTAHFTIDMHGSWNGDTGTLYEKFHFSDGDTHERSWTITHKGENRFVGTAPDVIGPAEGKVVGNAVNWQYVMTLPLKDPKYDITLDDWMWRIDENTVMNTIYMSKFGFNVGRMTITMQKQ